MQYQSFSSAIAVALFLSSAAQAATSFVDRSAFIAQTSPQGSVDFNDVPAGSSFEDQDLTVGNMTLRGGVFPISPGGWNLIAPGGACTGLNFDLTQIDGTNFACSFVNPEFDLRVDFNAPVTSWGADFRDIADTDRRTKLSFFDGNDDLIADYVAEGLGDSEISFIGLDLMGAEATHLIFSIIIDDVEADNLDLFAMDNALFSTARGTDVPNPAPVPLPPAMALFLSAGGALAGLRRLKSNPSKSPS
ncbi:MAG: hypothetical protein AAF667_16110 [Pseudomonadota bacterium]